MFKAAVLFARSDSIYKTISGLDVYDKERDAKTYNGDLPVIAHPPCRLWSKLRKFSTAPVEEKNLAFFGLSMVRRNGGILEHPEYSSFWKVANLPYSGLDKFGGYSLRISQYDFGHRAAKGTWLYIVGLKFSNLPSIPKRLGIPTVICGGVGRGRVGEISKSERQHTPLLFAEWLVKAVSTITHKPQKPRKTPFDHRSERKPVPSRRTDASNASPCDFILSGVKG